jgi:hypothetical protein
VAYYLFNTTNTPSVTITSTSIGATNGDYIEFSGFASSGNAASAYRIIGISGSFNTLIELKTNSIFFRPGNITFNTNYTHPPVGQDFIIKIVKITGGYECFLNGVSVGTGVSSSQMTFNQFFAFNTGRSESFLGGCYYIKASNNGGVSDTNFWDSSASNGTGTTLKDTVGNNDGTLNGFAGTTNSWWVFYGTAATILAPTAIASSESFGSPTITTGAVLIYPVAIATQESVGIPVIQRVKLIVPSAIASLEFVGNPIIELILQQIFPNGIPTQEFLGTPLVIGGDVLAIPTAQRQTWNSVANYLRIVGFKGADNDVIVAWLRSEGIVDGTYNDLWNKYLLQNGFSALTLADNYAAWRQNLATALFENGVLTCSGTLSCEEIIPCGE